MSVKQKHNGAPWLYSESTGDIVGVKDPDGSEFFFARAANFGLFADMADQTAAAINTPTVITFGTALAEHGVSMVSGSKITFDRGGWFKFTLTAQLHNTDSQIQDMHLWGRLNGADIPGTLTDVAVTESHGGVPGAMVLERSYFANVNAGDYVEVVWMVSNTMLILKSHAASTSPAYPTGPSVNLSVFEAAA